MCDWLRTSLRDWQRLLLQPARCQPASARRLLPHLAGGLLEADRRPARRFAGCRPVVVRDVHPGASQVQGVDGQSARPDREDERDIRQSHRLSPGIQYAPAVTCTRLIRFKLQ